MVWGCWVGNFSIDHLAVVIYVFAGPQGQGRGFSAACGVWKVIAFMVALPRSLACLSLSSLAFSKFLLGVGGDRGVNALDGSPSVLIAIYVRRAPEGNFL